MTEAKKQAAVAAKHSASAQGRSAVRNCVQGETERGSGGILLSEAVQGNFPYLKRQRLEGHHGSKGK